MVYRKTHDATLKRGGLQENPKATAIETRGSLKTIHILRNKGEVQYSIPLFEKGCLGQQKIP